MIYCVTDYIMFCVEGTAPTKRVRCFPSNKPWVTSELKTLLNEKKRLFTLGNKEEFRMVKNQPRCEIRKAKVRYKEKVEERFRRHDMREVWRGLRAISGYDQDCGRGVISGDQNRAN